MCVGLRWKPPEGIPTPNTMRSHDPRRWLNNRLQGAGQMSLATRYAYAR